MKVYDDIYEKWWMKYIVFPLLIGIVLMILGPGISIDNRGSVSSPVLIESPKLNG